MRVYIWLTLLAIIALTRAVPLPTADGSQESSSKSAKSGEIESEEISLKEDNKATDGNDKKLVRRSPDIPDTDGCKDHKDHSTSHEHEEHDEYLKHKHSGDEHKRSRRADKLSSEEIDVVSTEKSKGHQISYVLSADAVPSSEFTSEQYSSAGQETVANGPTSEEHSSQENGQKGGDARRRREASAEADEDNDNMDDEYVQGCEIMESSRYSANEAVYDDGADERIKRSTEDSSDSNNTSEEDKRKGGDKSAGSPGKTVANPAGEAVAAVNAAEVGAKEAEPTVNAAVVSTEQMLRLEPTEILVFPRAEPRETFLELTCISNFPITYKIQTTSPEKFRVRPRMGILLPRESVVLCITLKPERELADGMKDKFLVLALPVPPGVEPTQEVTEVWKTKTSNRSDVEQHRIACTYKIFPPIEPALFDYPSAQRQSQLHATFEPQVQPQLTLQLQPEPEPEPPLQQQMQLLPKQKHSPPQLQSQLHSHSQLQSQLQPQAKVSREEPLPLRNKFSYKGFEPKMSEDALVKQLRYTQYLLLLVLGLMLVLGITVGYLLKVQFSDMPRSYDSEMTVPIALPIRGRSPRMHDYPAVTMRGPGHERTCPAKGTNLGNTNEGQNKHSFPVDKISIMLLCCMIVSGVLIGIQYYTREAST